ncbi:MAG: hypothetical protein RTU63_00885 [Candidatus Thorarchaeota archaeon]
MQRKVLIVLGITFTILISLLPTINANLIIIDSGNEESPMIPIVTGNTTSPLHIQSQYPLDMCVSDSGITFSVNIFQGWELIMGFPQTSFTAWNSDGSLRWVKKSSSTVRRLSGIAIDHSYVYVTGSCSGPYLGKFDYYGNSIWNATWDFDEGSYGLDVDVAHDGTIFVCGRMYNSSLEYVLIAFNPEGNITWFKEYEQRPSFVCSSNHVYVACDGILEKLETNGNVVWSSVIDSRISLSAKDEYLYSIPIPDIGYSSYIFHVGYRSLVTSIDVTRWNASTGERIWTNNIGIQNSNTDVYNCSWIRTSIDQSGSIVLLMKVYDLGQWYALRVNSEGTQISSICLLDDTWRLALLKYGDSGNIHVTGYGDLGLSMAIFDSKFPIDGLNIPLIALVSTGVILFNLGLILYLKKRYQN